MNGYLFISIVLNICSFYLIFLLYFIFEYFILRVILSYRCDLSIVV